MDLCSYLLEKRNQNLSVLGLRVDDGRYESVGQSEILMKS